MEIMKHKMFGTIMKVNDYTWIIGKALIKLIKKLKIL